MSGILLVAATEPELCGHAGLVCGIGPVEAAVSVAARLASDPPRAVLHLGVAGARRASGVEVLDVVVGETAIYEDLSTSRSLAPASAPPDPLLLDAVLAAVPAARVLAIGTTARVGGADGCVVEAMEGFAVLRACALAGVPAVEVRAISNLVEDDRSAWRMDEAVRVLGGVLPRLLAAVATALRAGPEV